MVILAYRGTRPANLISWLTDADVHPDRIAFVVEPLGAAFGFVADQLKVLRSRPLQFSFSDHGPQHYVSALTPPGTPNEFGDAKVLSGS